MDVKLIAAAVRGDRPAQALLLRDLQDPWYRMCLSLLGDPDRARDATQESALRLLRQLPGFRGDSQLRTWALGIAINVVREIRRKSPSAGPLDPDAFDRIDPDEPTPDEHASAGEQRAAVRALLEDLPDRQREAIVLRYFEELSVEQTARIMRCATGTVKATVHQAIKTLKQRMRQFT